MYFKKEDIDKLLARLRIEDVVGTVVDLKRSGSSYKGLCPFHSDTNPSFMVNPSKNICKCFVCGEGGNPISFYAKYHKISFFEAAKELADKNNIVLKEVHIDKEKNKELEKYFDIMQEAHIFFKKNIFENLGRNALEYLSKRNINPNMIVDYGLGYARDSFNSLHDFLISKNYSLDDLLKLGLVKKNEDGKVYDTFRNRIIFPIYSASKKVIAFGGRTLENRNNVPKYINSPDTPIFKKGNTLYGLDRINIVKSKNYSILMEGYMDALSSLTYGFDTTLAPLGTALTTEQVKLLKKYSSNVILAFDMDTAGRAATEKAGFLLAQQGFKIRVLEYQNAKDPDEFLKKYGKAEFLKCVKDSKEIFDFLYDTYISLYDVEDIMSKQKFIERFKEFFSYVSNDLEKSIYLDRLAKKIDIDKNVLFDVLIKNNDFKPIINVFGEDVKEKIHQKNESLQDINLELSILKYLCIKPNMFNLFDKYEFKNSLALKIYKNFFKKIEEDLQISSINNIERDFEKIIKNLKIFIEGDEDFQEEDKKLYITELVIYNFNNSISRREELELFKSVLRKQLKNIDMKQLEIIDKIKLKQLEISALNVKKLEDFIEVYEKELKKYL